MGDPRNASWRAGGLKGRGVALVALGALLLGVAACSESDDAGGDEEEAAETGNEADHAELLGPEDEAGGEPVRIGMISDGATPAFDNTDELRSAQATAEFWNTHRGGVGGRPIEVVTCETGGDPAGATDCGNQMVEDEVVAVALSQSAVAEAVWEPVHDAGIPTFYLQMNGDAMLTDTESSFVMANPSTTFYAVPTAVAESTGTDKIAFVIIDVPVALTTFTSGQVDQVLGNAGLEHELVTVPPGTADMTSQMQQVADSGAGVVHVIGDPAFCIAAFNGLSAVGYEGEITTISQCINDSTREGVEGDQLEGISITATTALGDTEDPAYQLYQAVAATYGQDIEDVDDADGYGAYTTMASLAAALEGIEGEITPETVIDTLKSMEETPYPGADGLTFQCGGSVFPPQPAVCMNGSLRATLDAEGEPATYEPIDPSDILEGL